MVKIVKADKDACRTIRQNLDVILQDVCSELGIKGATGKMSYDPTLGTITMKIEFSVPNAAGETITSEGAAFRSNAGYFGFKPEDLGTSFNAKGKTWTIIGLRPQAHVRPIVCSCSDGKVYHVPAQQVLRFMGRTPAQDTTQQDLKILLSRLGADR